MTKAFSLLLVLLFLPSAIAKTQCGNYDLRGPKLGPPRDQGESNWCFAYTTADLLSHKLGKKISASDLAITYLGSGEDSLVRLSKIFRKDGDQGGGTEIGALAASRNKGLCLESNMPSTPESFKDYLSLRGIRSVAEAQNQLEFYRRCVSDENYCMPSKLFTQENLCDVIRVALRAGKFSSNEDLAKNQDKACAPRIPIPSKLKFVRRWAADGTALNAIMANLKKGQPVSIQHRNDLRNSNAPHSALVVASRSKDGDCEFLVRGSDGPTCEGFNGKYECDTKDPGHVWVKEGDLRKILSSVIFIQ